jgi:hypothetical protein
MSRSKKFRKGKRQSGPADASQSARREVRALLHGAVVFGGLVAVVAAGIGVLRLERYVLTRDSFRRPPVLQLVDAPEGIRNELMAALDPVRRRIADILQADAWVKEVCAVRKYGGGRIDIRCEYRRPIALIQHNGLLYLVSQDQVRLPGTYVRDPRLMLVEGVGTPPPAPGKVWAAPDLKAAVGLAERLRHEPFAEQITGVLVDNYGGRVNPEEAHIRLATDRSGATIIWGSAPGEEQEENSIAEKIAILRENFRRFGRVDANRRTIDISVHPDRFTTPT